MSEPCHRCGEPTPRGYPLDVDFPEIQASWVCEECLKDTDEVVDL